MSAGDGLSSADGSHVFVSDREQVGLVPQCARAKDLCFEYNYRTRPSDLERQQALLGQLLGALGSECRILAPLMVDNGFNVFVGDHFFAAHNLVILDSAPVRFGSHVYLGPNVSITAVGHPLDAEQRNQGIEYAYPIEIGSYVWIGAGSCILPGVTIGSHVVIEAGSLVNRSLPDGVVAAGNPCRVVRKLSAADCRQFLGGLAGSPAGSYESACPDCVPATV